MTVAQVMTKYRTRHKHLDSDRHSIDSFRTVQSKLAPVGHTMIQTPPINTHKPNSTEQIDDIEPKDSTSQLFNI